MFHTQGIILKKNMYREYDEILTIWTRDFGKIEAIARGIKKPLSKLNGHLQVFDLSDIEFALGKRFKVLTGARLIQGHCQPNLFDVRRQTFASFFNFLDEITPLEDADSRVWQLCLDVAENGDNTGAARQRLLRLTGFAP